MSTPRLTLSDRLAAMSDATGIPVSTFEGDIAAIAKQRLKRAQRRRSLRRAAYEAALILAFTLVGAFALIGVATVFLLPFVLRAP